jgi:regulator of chromosome condensation (RCC1) repeat-containing protein/Regulator of Chromosome Condensation (RCC1) repeat protein
MPMTGRQLIPRDLARKPLRFIALGAVVLLTLPGLAVFGLPSVAQAGPIKPTVSSFAATPSSLSPLGGMVTLSAQVTNATNCVFSSNRIVTGLPATIPCSNGTVTAAVSLPPSSSKRPTPYRFHLSVIGAKTITAPAVTLAVAAGGLPTAVVASGDSTCALLAAGTVECWGLNSAGQLGNGTTTDSFIPVAVSGLTGATAVSGGVQDACALLAGGTVECWGSGQYGELGNGTTTDSSTPVVVSGLDGVTAISGADDSTCALLAGGSVDCWGDNSGGELGDGTSTGPDTCSLSQLACSTTPVAVSALNGVIAISGEGQGTCALLTGGTVDCWGDNNTGQLGDGSFTGPQDCGFYYGLPIACSTTPVAVSGLSGVAAVAGSCALLTGGTVDCWGNNDSGELGDGSFPGPQQCGFDQGPYGQPVACSTTPVVVSGLSGASAITGTCALLAGGTVDCWGDNRFGELGDGTDSGPQQCKNSDPCSTLPVAVSGLSGATTVSDAVGSHVCALLTAGTIDCWGDNFGGDLGGGGRRHGPSTIPRKVKHLP